jgi:hypothetical protein
MRQLTLEPDQSNAPEQFEAVVKTAIHLNDILRLSVRYIPIELAMAAIFISFP